MKINETDCLQNGSAVSPHVLMNEFFEWYSLEGCKQELAQLTANSLPAGSDETAGRSDVLFFQEKLNSLLEAAWLVCQTVPDYENSPVN